MYIPRPPVHLLAYTGHALTEGGSEVEACEGEAEKGGKERIEVE
jgi:hypothetical protein